MDDGSLPRGRRALRLLVALLFALVLGYVGYLGLALGPRFWEITLAAWLRGEERVLQPAELRGPPLRAGDRVYLLTTQAERVVPLRLTRRAPRLGRPREMLHVDLWAVNAATAAPAWTRRLRTFERDRGRIDFAILGFDAGVLWLFVREPIAVAAADGVVLADGARLEAMNPPLAGTRVDEDGYVAFGAQGLQLTLTDATQWAVPGDTFRAQPRASAPTRTAVVLPALPAGTTGRFQLRGLPIGRTAWLGVLTDEEAATLRAEPVVPGAAPGERRGAAAELFARGHVPERLRAEPRSYRLWRATVTQVSAAPAGWSPDLPDTWGTRDQFGDYQPLPDAPPFLQAGLLGDGRSEQAFWVREPDGVLVLHRDALGPTGRLRLTRVAGPGGRVVWDAALGIAEARAVSLGGAAIAVVGVVPNAAYAPDDETSRPVHETLVTVDVASGRVGALDVTAASVGDGGGAAPGR